MRLSPALLLLPLLTAACQNNATPQTQPTATARPTTPDAPLRNTRWVLRQLAGRPIALPADTREVYLLLRTDSVAEGNGGCNKFRGSFFSQTAGELKFTPLMSTRMSCPAIGTESDFMRALGQSNTYRISGDTLRIVNAGQTVVARLEAVYLR